MLAEFTRELTERTERALAKRDRCIRFVRHIESQVEFGKQEEARLHRRRTGLQNALDRFKDYLLLVIQNCAPASKHGPLRLEGQTGALAAVKNPAAVEIIDAALLPAEFVRVEVRLEGEALQGYPDVKHVLMGICLDYQRAPVKDRIALALKAGREVPGARLRKPEMRLDIR